MLKGKVKSLKESGYGYVILNDMSHTGGKDVFFHLSDVENDAFYDLSVGEEVVCKDLVKNAKGYHCVCLAKIA